jgi:hypothetical protein
VALLLAACQKPRDISGYYFPLDSLADGRVYEYEVWQDSARTTSYWYYKSVPDIQPPVLLGLSYAADFTPEQLIREEKVENGMLLADFRTYEFDTANQRQIDLPGEIEHGNVFSFELRQPPGILLSSVRWQSVLDSSVYSLTRNRQYERDTTILFNGRSLPAIVLHVRELVDHDKQGHWQQEYSATEIYAQGIGLVHTSKQFDKGLSLRFQLTDIYPMDTLEARFHRSLGNN